MHADIPSNRETLDVSANLLLLLDPEGRINDVLDGLLGARRGYTVKQDMPADFGLGIVFAHTQSNIWQRCNAGTCLVYRANPAVMRQQLGDHRFVDPIRAVLRMLEFLDGNLTDFRDGLAGQHGDAREGAIVVLGLLNPSEGRLEGKRVGVCCGHGIAPNDGLKARTTAPPRQIGRRRNGIPGRLVASTAEGEAGGG